MESSFTRRSLSGIAMGAAATAGLSRIDASPGQRVAIPALFGAFIVLALPDERDIGVSVVLGAMGASGALSASQGQSPWEFLPEDMRPGSVAETIRSRRQQRSSDRRAALMARADKLL